MKSIGIGLLGLIVGFVGCSKPRMDHDEVLAMITEPDRGLMAGVALGDPWESVKAKHHPKFTIRDEKTSTSLIRQLRMDTGKPFENLVRIDFETDAAGVISGMRLEVDGRALDHDDGHRLRDVPDVDGNRDAGGDEEDRSRHRVGGGA